MSFSDSIRNENFFVVFNQKWELVNVYFEYANAGFLK